MDTLTATPPVALFALPEAEYARLNNRIKDLEEKNDGLYGALNMANDRAIKLIESYQKQVKEQTEKINRLEFALEHLKLFSAKFCDEQEGIWDSEESLASAEIAMDYLVAAKYLRDNYGRDDAGNIDRIQDWLGRPWEH